ncbi:hypothetical protein [Mesorhizobium sp. LSHC412B00]|uniref:hypothetical protein n=1 Tax=Mesorhizobium sp. LSHC412B00 TaxID=1287285 RepID=UPI0003CECC60|nr:hypothetical protein [Mesorhizobium sp. LSHC412B00]ESX91384.1 hypothetical protein X756_04475 [Mesorhizobium sp. LSHC412B00]
MLRREPNADDIHLAETMKGRRAADLIEATEDYLRLAMRDKSDLQESIRPLVGDRAAEIVDQVISDAYYGILGVFGQPLQADKIVFRGVHGLPIAYEGVLRRTNPLRRPEPVSLAFWLRDEIKKRFLPRNANRFVPLENGEGEVDRHIQTACVIPDEYQGSDALMRIDLWKELKPFLSVLPPEDRFIVESVNGLHEDLTFARADDLRERLRRAGLTSRARVAQIILQIRHPDAGLLPATKLPITQLQNLQVAALLGVHKNTVGNRLKKAEALMRDLAVASRQTG